jgi:type IV pilus assembly protein PilN
MFNLDINFLKDREPEAQERVAAAPIADSQFLIIGGAVAAGLVTIVTIMYFVAQTQIDSLQAELATLTTQEQALDAQLKVIGGSEASIKVVEERNRALVALLVKDIPTSVLMQDIKIRTPSSVQVSSIAQAGKVLTIIGQSTGYDEANDFLLLLQRSPYLDPKATKLASAKQQAAQKDVAVTLVDYQITTSLTPSTTDKLVADLEKSEAQGAVTRVKFLQEKGVITQ